MFERTKSTYIEESRQLCDRVNLQNLDERTQSYGSYIGLLDMASLVWLIVYTTQLLRHAVVLFVVHRRQLVPSLL